VYGRPRRLYALSAVSSDADSSRHFTGVSKFLCVADRERFLTSCAWVQLSDLYTGKLGFSVEFVYGDPPFYGRLRRDHALQPKASFCGRCSLWIYRRAKVALRFDHHDLAQDGKCSRPNEVDGLRNLETVLPYLISNPQSSPPQTTSPSI
jgi:hypothetical protein